MPSRYCEINSNIHYMEKGAGINWHNDASWKYGATYYLNNRWNQNWGGEFMFTSKNGHGYIPIVGNSLVIIKSPLEHKVNPVLSPLIPKLLRTPQYRSGSGLFFISPFYFLAWRWI